MQKQTKKNSLPLENHQQARCSCAQYQPLNEVWEGMDPGTTPSSHSNTLHTPELPGFGPAFHQVLHLWFRPWLSISTTPYHPLLEWVAWGSLKTSLDSFTGRWIPQSAAQFHKDWSCWTGWKAVSKKVNYCGISTRGIWRYLPLHIQLTGNHPSERLKSSAKELKHVRIAKSRGKWGQRNPFWSGIGFGCCNLGSNYF